MSPWEPSNRAYFLRSTFTQLLYEVLDSLVFAYQCRDIGRTNRELIHLPLSPRVQKMISPRISFHMLGTMRAQSLLNDSLSVDLTASSPPYEAIRKRPLRLEIFVAHVASSQRISHWCCTRSADARRHSDVLYSFRLAVHRIIVHRGLYRISPRIGHQAFRHTQQSGPAYFECSSISPIQYT